MRVHVEHIGLRVKPSEAFKRKSPHIVTGDGEIVGVHRNGSHFLVKWELYSQAMPTPPDFLEPV